MYVLPVTLILRLSADTNWLSIMYIMAYIYISTIKPSFIGSYFLFTRIALLRNLYLICEWFQINIFFFFSPSYVACLRSVWVCIAPRSFVTLSPSGAASKRASHCGESTPHLFFPLIRHNHRCQPLFFRDGADVTRESDVSPAGSHPPTRKTLLTRRDSRR